MTQIGEGVYTPPDEPVDQKDGKLHINLRVHVFNDGTCNNRTNTLSRHNNSEAYQRLKKPNDSYENELSNIAKLAWYVKGEPTPGYHQVLSVYVEGPGTIDDEPDKKVGYAVGLGPSGIRAKVERGLGRIVEQIRTKLEEQYKEEKEIVIDRLTLDLFGFSRGAAVARNMIHEVLFGPYPLKARLEDEIECKTVKVEVSLVGLYDTVSSHGRSFADDTAELRLDAIYHAAAVLQLAAADEHRANFSLTDISSVGKRGVTIFLPGVHSDIGGSYGEKVVEQQVIYQGTRVNAEQERDMLIAAGWYQPHEIELKTISVMEQEKLVQIEAGQTGQMLTMATQDMVGQALKMAGHVVGPVAGPAGPALALAGEALALAQLEVCRPRSLRAERDRAAHASWVVGGDPIPRDPRLPPPKEFYIPNHYSRIPLQIMARAARQWGLVFDDGKMEKREAIPDGLHEAQGQISRYLARTCNGGSSAEDWHHNEPWLRALRHDYLHFSARVAFGLGPRFINGKRKRMTYAG